MSLEKINLADPTPDLYDTVADGMARLVSQADKGKNKSTQLRRFYDEIVMWDQKLKTNPDAFSECLPLIRMMNAKVAYAHGRHLVDDTFRDLMRRCLSQVTDAKTFANCKRFLEAFMGFYKMYQPK